MPEKEGQYMCGGRVEWGTPVSGSQETAPHTGQRKRLLAFSVVEFLENHDRRLAKLNGLDNQQGHIPDPQ